MVKLVQPTTTIPTPSSCTVVIPCYNEASRLNADMFKRFLSSTPTGTIRLLFVNDGSRDGTLPLIMSLADEFPGRASVLNQEKNRGKAETVRNGMMHVIQEGQSAFTGFWDADLATPLDQINDFLQVLESHDHLKMVFGARVRLLGRSIQRQAIRHYLGRCFATAASILLRVPIYDTQCGAKLFRITPELHSVLTGPFHSRWIFDVEILARFLAMERGDVKWLEQSLYEFPLSVWNDVKGSKVRSSDFFRAFGELGFIYGRYLAHRSSPATQLRNFPVTDPGATKARSNQPSGISPQS